MPETDFDPLHPPEAVHDVAFCDDHVSAELWPCVTDVGDAESVSVGV